MSCKLFQTESNTFFAFVEIENNHIEFLIKLHDFFRTVDTSPTEVGDVDKSVDTTQIDEYTVGCNVFDCSFKNLTFFELGNDLSLLGFEFVFDKGFVRYNNVFEFIVDLDDFEIHDLSDKNVVIADWLHVNL
ncbi:hypothetical protein SDC9_70945 [bioreactor metagenome]|uniref:Uncharacterized protein n=1 Tax=bioreactor metagenome TaxID=1076179 RepID=A0A644YD54_9ZZZZ